MAEIVVQRDEKKPKKTAIKVLEICGFCCALALLVGLLINALLCVFVDHYYPTFGNYRLFAIVSDSMEPEIPTGNMIVGRVPKDESEIQVGTVITFESPTGNSHVLITHRVTAVNVNSQTGAVTYTTRGDNAEGFDAYRPTFDDVVGIYTGNRCGFFGYFFGFLQSSEGAITLIIIALIVALTWIIIHFVNLVSIWRKVAIEALKKSGAILADTQIEELGTIADVIGIVSKDPLDKKDIRRKDKKLHWFIRTGALPRRPYNDDFDEQNFDGEAVVFPKLMLADEEQHTDQQSVEPAPETVPITVPEEVYSRIVRERSEKMSYTYTYTARLIQLKPQQKEWYSAIKNELLSYRKIRSRRGNKNEIFSLGRRTAARIAVRGKTLCLLLDMDPERFAGSKYAVERVNSSTPCLYRIKNARRAKYSFWLISELMRESGAEKNPDYEAQDFYLPYEGLVALMNKGLVKRNLVSSDKTYKIEEISEDDEFGDEEEEIAVETDKN